MNFLQKIQNLSLNKRKAIVWTCALIIGLIFLGLTIRNLKKNLEAFNGGNTEFIKAPNFEELQKNSPKENISNDLQGINKLLQEAGNQQKSSESNTLNEAK